MHNTMALLRRDLIDAPGKSEPPSSEPSAISTGSASEQHSDDYLHSKWTHTSKFLRDFTSRKAVLAEELRRHRSALPVFTEEDRNSPVPTPFRTNSFFYESDGSVLLTSTPMSPVFIHAASHPHFPGAASVRPHTSTFPPIFAPGSPLPVATASLDMLLESVLERSTAVSTKLTESCAVPERKAQPTPPPPSRSPSKRVGQHHQPHTKSSDRDRGRHQHHHTAQQHTQRAEASAQPAPPHIAKPAVDHSSHTAPQHRPPHRHQDAAAPAASAASAASTDALEQRPAAAPTVDSPPPKQSLPPPISVVSPSGPETLAAAATSPSSTSNAQGSNAHESVGSPLPAVGSTWKPPAQHPEQPPRSEATPPEPEDSTVTKQYDHVTAAGAAGTRRGKRRESQASSSDLRLPAAAVSRSRAAGSNRAKSKSSDGTRAPSRGRAPGSPPLRSISADIKPSLPDYRPRTAAAAPASAASSNTAAPTATAVVTAADARNSTAAAASAVVPLPLLPPSGSRPTSASPSPTGAATASTVTAAANTQNRRVVSSGPLIKAGSLVAGPSLGNEPSVDLASPAFRDEDSSRGTSFSRSSQAQLLGRGPARRASFIVGPSGPVGPLSPPVQSSWAKSTTTRELVYTRF